MSIQMNSKGSVLLWVVLVIFLITQIVLISSLSFNQNLQFAKIETEKMEAEIAFFNTYSILKFKFLTEDSNGYKIIPTKKERVYFNIPLDGSKIKFNINEYLKLRGLNSKKKIKSPIEVTISVQDVAGLINMNDYDSQNILLSLFNKNGIGYQSGRSIIDSYRDWVDLDSEVREFGGEADAYSKKKYNIKNYPLTSPDEIKFVNNTSNKNFLKLFPYIVWETEKFFPNFNTMPKEILGAFPGISENQVDTILRMRKKFSSRSLIVASMITGYDFLPFENWLADSSSGYYRISLNINLTNDVVFYKILYMSEREVFFNEDKNFGYSRVSNKRFLPNDICQISFIKTFAKKKNEK